MIDSSSSLKTFSPKFQCLLWKRESIHNMFNELSECLQLYHKAPSAERSLTAGTMQNSASTARLSLNIWKHLL